MGTSERRVLGMAIPAMLVSLAGVGAATQFKGVSVGDVEVWGTTRPERREVDGALRVHVRTPFGRIPITGHARAAYTCNATFDGTLQYGALVRLFAHIKGVDLVSQADGAIEFPVPWDCESPPREFRGQAVIRDSVLDGFLRLGEDSIPLHGRAWTVGDSTYHSRIQAARACDPFLVRLNLYER